CGEDRRFGFVFSSSAAGVPAALLTDTSGSRERKAKAAILAALQRRPAQASGCQALEIPFRLVVPPPPLRLPAWRVSATLEAVLSSPDPGGHPCRAAVGPPALPRRGRRSWPCCRPLWPT